MAFFTSLLRVVCFTFTTTTWHAREVSFFLWSGGFCLIAGGRDTGCFTWSGGSVVQIDRHRNLLTLLLFTNRVKGHLPKQSKLFWDDQPMDKTSLSWFLFLGFFFFFFYSNIHRSTSRVFSSFYLFIYLTSFLSFIYPSPTYLPAPIMPPTIILTKQTPLPFSVRKFTP